jgi:hypothetical protein
MDQWIGKMGENMQENYGKPGFSHVCTMRIMRIYEIYEE